MKKKLLLIVLSTSLFCGCGFVESGDFKNQISCKSDSIVNNPTEFELDCDRKFFRIYSPDSKTEIMKYFVSDCNEDGNFTSAQLYINSSDKNINLLIDDDNFLLVNGNVFCDEVDDCEKACKANDVLKKVKNVNENLDFIRNSI
ncbi:hypothetical protein [Fibrobacter sp. UBA2449]|uniref:hypothetical protein n=1 Tax=Fibrobacter sp. UBA2449 TaxID=1946529 RepID=UPI0025BA6B80|nr:hypothetical protein [Fibrobacter sp. UBA2449]